MIGPRGALSMIGVALLAVVAVLALAGHGGAGARGPSARHGRAILHVAPGGHDGAACGRPASPCASLGGAFAVAPPGAEVELSSGVYGEQRIGGEAPKRSPRAITFRPAPGAKVRFAGTIFVFGSHIVIEHMAVQDVTIGNYDQTPGRPNPTDVRLLDLAGRNFQIDSATHVTVRGGTWGPASACGGPYGGTNNSIREPTSVVPSAILIDSVTIRDVQSYNLVGCHIEGLAIFAGRGVTVENSRFYGNSVYDVFVQPNSGPISGLLFRNDWMAMPIGLNGVENGTVIGFAGLSSNVRLIGNRFNYVISLNDAGLNPVYSNFRLQGNVGVLPYAGCTLRGITWVANLWRNGACSSSDVSLHGRPLPYRNGSNGPSLDYRLTGATPVRWRRLRARL